MNRQPIILLLALLLLAPFGSALSVTPARIVFDTPGEHAFAVTAINDGEGGTVSIRAQGDLAQHIMFVRTEQDFTHSVRFEGVINVPEDLAPGDYGQELVLSVQPREGDFVSTTLEISSLLVVRKSYPGPYLVADLYAAPDDGLADTTNVYIGVENRGEQAVTPTVVLLRNNRSQAVTASEVPARGSASFSTVLRGRGEEQVTLLVDGAQPLRKEFIIPIGHPAITSLQAQSIPESGLIKPVRISAAVDWNRPVSALLDVAGKTYSITINNTFEETYYIETNASFAPITLTVGAQQQNTTAVFASAPAAPAARMRWEWLALIVLLLLLLLVLYRLWRQAKAVA